MTRCPPAALDPRPYPPEGGTAGPRGNSFANGPGIPKHQRDQLREARAFDQSLFARLEPPVPA